jgi:hypothetical protein
VKRTKDDAQIVFLRQRGIAADAEADDLVRLGVLADDADDQRVAAGKHSHRRAVGGGNALLRVNLREGVDHLGRLPCRLVHQAVHVDGLGPGSGAQRRRRRFLRGCGNEKRAGRQEDDRRRQMNEPETIHG